MPVQKFVDPNAPGPLSADRPFCDRLRDSERQWTLTSELVVPPRSGKAWPVLAGQICRILTNDGPQVGDMNAWNLHNPREHMWASRSRQLNGAHVTTYSRLWSNLPYLRPLLTFIDDTVPLSATGIRAHDLLGTRCDPYLYKLVEGDDVDFTCHTLLSRAIAPFHLTELDVHDVLNLFQPTGLDPHDEIPIVDAVAARAGDHVDFFAEIDLLVAVAACHSGDFTTEGSQVAGGQQARQTMNTDPFPTCKSLKVEVYAPEPSLLLGWASPEPVKLSSVYGNAR